MSGLNRREAWGLAAGALAAATGLAKAQTAVIPSAEVDPPRLRVERTAHLNVLRPPRTSQTEAATFAANSQAFTETSGIKVDIAYAPDAELATHIAAAANSDSGADIVFAAPNGAHLHSDKLVALSDIADYLGKKYGGWYPLAERLGKRFASEDWIAIPFAASGIPALYRKSYLKEAGFNAFPRNLDDFLKLCRRLRENGHPAGFSLGRTAESNAFCHWLVWAHGGAIVDEAQKITINSRETIEALKYGKALFESLIPGTLSWLDGSNRDSLVADDIGLTQDGLSLYLALKTSSDADAQHLAQDLDHARMPIGPVGFGTETTHALVATVLATSPFPNAAKSYVAYMMEAEPYDRWLTAARGYFAQSLKAYEASDVWKKDPVVAVNKDAMKSSLWYGFKGPISEGSVAFVNDFVMVEMVAAVAMGVATPEEAAAEAARRARRYYEG